jgi:FkbM family methyltransferase
MWLIKSLKRAFNFLGLEIIPKNDFNWYQSNNKNQHEIILNQQDAFDRLKNIIAKSNFPDSGISETGFLKKSINNLLRSKAQLFQDLFVLYILKDKQNGFFVEFGACDGVELSNTYLLENEYGWKGILSEPGKIWQKKLSQNRKVHIDYRCVWSKSGEQIQFNETEIPGLSTMSEFSDIDFHAEKRKSGNFYFVETISLNDLLDHYDAPVQIDYLSLDTEGSEFEILNSFNFDKYQVKVITVEHNYSVNREKIFKLLTGKGFKRIFESISAFDDWYIHHSVS